MMQRILALLVFVALSILKEGKGDGDEGSSRPLFA
jgi:hypothetical protein